MKNERARQAEGEKNDTSPKGRRVLTYLVVIRQLLADFNVAVCEDDNVLGAFDLDDAAGTVGVAGVVDKARGIADERRVNNDRIVYAEHVAANIAAVIVVFPLVLARE